jgi:LysM repeat protein
MPDRPSPYRRSLFSFLLLSIALPSSAPAAIRGNGPADAPVATAAAAETDLAADQFSPGFLGIYRKVMEIEPEILKYAKKYDVDVSLARAVCMYESGGNGDLTSGAGAKGYFQVMPSTFRLLGVQTNIEAGIKYLGQLIRQFDREDYALAAYNGGPGRVVRGRGLPLESLQYVLGVGHYRSVLHMHEAAVRRAASTLTLSTSRVGDTWEAISKRVGMSVIELRLYNPFLTDARLRRGGRLVAYPRIGAVPLLQTGDDGRIRYRARLGDNYFNIAFAFEVGLDALRSENGLWRLQVLPPGMVLTIPDADAIMSRAPAVERAAVVTPPPAPEPEVRLHRVTRGENLTVIARRYGTTVAELRAANGLRRSSVIRPGQRLRIPLD